METTATTKGQIVIPSALRRRFGIKDGTRINIEVDEKYNQIILKPITTESIRKFRGSLKKQPGQKSALQLLLDERAEDLKREERKDGRHRIR